MDLSSVAATTMLSLRYVPLGWCAVASFLPINERSRKLLPSYSGQPASLAASSFASADATVSDPPFVTPSWYRAIT
jgi:hypothetical protein